MYLASWATPAAYLYVHMHYAAKSFLFNPTNYRSLTAFFARLIPPFPIPSIIACAMPLTITVYSTYTALVEDLA